MLDEFQSPRGEGVVQTIKITGQNLGEVTVSITSRCGGGSDDQGNRAESKKAQWFQSPRGEGVVQTANPQARMVMLQTGI